MQEQLYKPGKQNQEENPQSRKTNLIHFVETFDEQGVENGQLFAQVDKSIEFQRRRLVIIRLKRAVICRK